jgi:hypothetical protein
MGPWLDRRAGRAAAGGAAARGCLRRVGALATLALIWLLVVPAGSGAATALTAPRHDVVLSNETTSTTWSVPDYAVPIRSRARNESGVRGRLQFLTPDGFLQPYVLLREHWTRGAPWVELRIPGRPNGRTGWVPLGALDSFHHTDEQIVVDRAAERLRLYRGGRQIYAAPVGVGKPSTPTPPGHFWITEAFSSSDPFYGPWAFGTSDYSTLTEWPGGGIVGLHGTSEPWLVPGDPSHGCIRLHNSDIVNLSRLVQVGAPLLVR